MIISKRIGNFYKNNELGKKIVVSFCTCFGLGRDTMPEFSPFLGSVIGVFIYLLTDNFSIFIQILSILLFIFLTYYFSDIYEQIETKQSPSSIIIDETLGMWIALFLIKAASFKTILVAFVFFRFLDYFKLFPINLFQSLKGGKGIIADDLIAGMATNFIIRLFILRGAI